MRESMSPLKSLSLYPTWRGALELLPYLHQSYPTDDGCWSAEPSPSSCLPAEDVTTGPTSWRRPFYRSLVKVMSSCRSSTLHAAVRLAHRQLRVPLVARSDQRAAASVCAAGADKLRCLAAQAELEIGGARKAAACWCLRYRTGGEATPALSEDHARAGHDRISTIGYTARCLEKLPPVSHPRATPGALTRAAKNSPAASFPRRRCRRPSPRWRQA
jgi:hypothetical protein